MNKNEKNPSPYVMALIKFMDNKRKFMDNKRNVAIIDSLMAAIFIFSTTSHAYTLLVKTPTGTGMFILYLISFAICAYYAVKHTREAYKSIKKYRRAKRMARAAVML